MATNEENVRALARGIHQLNVNSHDAETITDVSGAIADLVGGGGSGGTTLTEDPDRPGVFLINGA